MYKAPFLSKGQENALISSKRINKDLKSLWSSYFTSNHEKALITIHTTVIIQEYKGKMVKTLVIIQITL